MGARGGTGAVSPDRLLDAAALRDWAYTAVKELITHIDEINRLNVFPVADCDTGTNMLFTMRAAVAEAGAEACSADVARVAAALATGALNGARGNSGVILSQILRGIADVTASAAADAGGELAHVDAGVLGAALRHGVDLAIASMGGREIPGTIISVIRAAADAVERCAADGEGLARAVTAAGDAALIALEKTPEQLDVLAEAGVVDAGGRGLLVLLDALCATITARPAARPVYQPAPRRSAPDAAGQPTPQFEVMYLLDGCDAAGADALRERLGLLGDSVAIATSTSQASGGEDGYSVHVHTDDAGAAVEAGLAFGSPRQIQISALTGAVRRPPPGGRTRERAHERAHERAIVAVVDGDGAAELFAGEGAVVLRPDPEAADPAAVVDAAQLLRAVVDTGAAQVMVLPNGYVPADELAAGCAAAIGRGIDVMPLPTGSMVQGLAALAVHEPHRRAVDDGYAMARAASATRHGSVRVATEKALTWAGPCGPGDALGIAGDEVVIVRPDVTAAATGLIDLLLAVGGELLTVLIGAGAGAQAAVIESVVANHLHDRHPGTELVTYRTGHRGDALVIGVE